LRHYHYRRGGEEKNTEKRRIMENTNTNTNIAIDGLHYDLESISSFSLRELMVKNGDQSLIIIRRNPEKELTLWKGTDSGKLYIETNLDSCEEDSDEFNLTIDEF
jgi:hypothetical protein